MLAGSELPVTTPYYSTNIPIWNDTLAANPAALDDWQDEWSAPEAREVVQSIGAWIVVVRKPASKQPNGGEDGGSPVRVIWNFVFFTYKFM